MIISVVAAKIWYLKKCAVFIGPPCIVLMHFVLKFLLVFYIDIDSPVKKTVN